MQLLVIGKIVHVIGNVLWLGGGALAALLLAQLLREEPAARGAGVRALRKLVLWLVTPGMLLSLGAGLVMLVSYWSELYAKAPWMHAKLTVGLVAAGFSGVLTGRLRRAASGTQVAPGAVQLAGWVLLLSAVAATSFVFLRFGQ